MKKYSGHSSKESDILFAQFLESSRQICDDLDVSYDDVEAERYEEPNVGVSYSTRGNGDKYKFYFFLKTDAENKDLLSGTMSASLDVTYSDNGDQFSFYEHDISWLKPHPNSLLRWAAWAVFNFNIKHNPVNLGFLFPDPKIRVYGLPNYTNPTIGEMHIVIGGIRQFPPQKLLVYRFRHVDQGDKYRSFSYAFRVSHTTFPPLWIFFLNCGGLDSGGAHGDFLKIEELIETIKTKVERIYFDISYDELKKFLQERGEGVRLQSGLDDMNYYFTDPSEVAFGERFVELFCRFKEEFKKENFADALRDMRVLVQEAMQLVCRKKNIPLDKEDNTISKISAKMFIGDRKDAILSNWFLAFSSSANSSSHKDFPTKNDLRDYTLKHRIMITFILGAHLIEELQKMSFPPQSEDSLKGKPFNLEIGMKENSDKEVFHEKLDGI
ncbi:MAG: hypothetical protein KGI19_08915 [Thaumarchaeota archaeon]|nr:hypothetical protein [Nitrososphaerota archaeon]